MVQVPLVLHGLEGRYATAMFTASSKEGKLQEVENDFNKMNSAINKNKNFKFFLNDPTMNKNQKIDIIIDLDILIGDFINQRDSVFGKNS